MRDRHVRGAREGACAHVAPKWGRDSTNDGADRNLVKSNNVPNWTNSFGYGTYFDLAAVQIIENIAEDASCSWLRQRLSFCYGRERRGIGRRVQEGVVASGRISGI